MVGHARAQEADPAPQADIFETDTLQTVLASVYRNNPQLLGERARLREIDENYIQARAQGRPSLTAGGELSLQATRSPVDGTNPFVPAGGGGWSDTTPSASQLIAIQPLYQGGRVKALKQQTKASIMAARAGLENAENNVFLSAANAYVDVLRDEETARIRRNNVRVLTRQLTAANERFDVGEGTRTDIAQSESRLAGAEAGLALADAQIANSRAIFVRYVGRMPDQLSPVPAFIVPDSLDQAIALARDNNPQLLAAYYNELAGTAAIDVAKAAGRPTVSLQGSLVRSRGTLLGFQDTDQATIGANVSVPIFSGGANASRVRQAKHAKTRLSFEARDVERIVDQTITQIWARMGAAKRIVATSQRQVAASDVAFEGVSLEQQVGTRTQLDVLDAEQETLNAKLTLINAERDYDAAVFQLLSTIGVLDADGIDLPITRHDPEAYFSDLRDDRFKRAGDRFIPAVFRNGEPEFPNLDGNNGRLETSEGEGTPLDVESDSDED
jgi:outer membrane protein